MKDAIQSELEKVKFLFRLILVFLFIYFFFFCARVCVESRRKNLTQTKMEKNMKNDGKEKKHTNWSYVHGYWSSIFSHSSIYGGWTSSQPLSQELEDGATLRQRRQSKNHT